jgi:hypothetical protein
MSGSSFFFSLYWRFMPEQSETSQGLQAVDGRATREIHHFVQDDIVARV